MTAETPGQRRGGVVRGALLPGLQPLADPTLLPAARSGTGRCRTELFTRRLSSSDTAAAPCPPPSAKLTVWGQAALPPRGDPVAESHLPATRMSPTALHSKILNSSSEQ